MINWNGSIQEVANNSLAQNRGFLYGDAVFETLKIANGKILFFEDHYFRLMASMRIVRMEIPMNFTPEFVETEILTLVDTLGISDLARVRITVYRNEGGLYLPTQNTISYTIQASAWHAKAYSFDAVSYEVDLYKDFYVTKQLLSTLKTTNKMVHITGSIYAKENDLDNCLLLNDSKNVTEALQGNLFMKTGGKLITPPLSEGCLNGVMRKQIIKIAKSELGIDVIEQPISPFELQKAEELFVTNVMKGIQPITKYRKKEFSVDTARQLVEKLNEILELN